VLDPDADLHRALPNPVETSAEPQVPGDVGRRAQHDVVDRGRHHPGLRQRAPRIGERRLLGELVENLQEQAEPHVGRHRLVHHHETPS